jgi:NADPH:quinone reductase-like Zn-dependent oxidoreductase
MRAIVFERYGPPGDVLRVAEVEEPAIGERDVLVRIRAASVNPADWHLIRGAPYIARLSFGPRRPRHPVPGTDMAGAVEAVGAEVTELAPGEEVYGSPFPSFGTFAERVRVPVEGLARAPAGLSPVEAAAVPVAALTALQGLRDHGRVRPGQRVLIIGASGGVGSFAVQIAVALGAEATGVSSAANLDLVRSLGAAHVIDYAREDVTRVSETYDLVLQVAGTASPAACRRLLTRDGTLVQISGDGDGRWVAPLGRIAAGRLLSPLVPQRVTSFTARPTTDDLRFLSGLIESGAVRPVIDRTWSLDEVPEAIGHLEAGHTRGKSVVAIGD